MAMFFCDNANSGAHEAPRMPISREAALDAQATAYKFAHSAELNIVRNLNDNCAGGTRNFTPVLPKKPAPRNEADFGIARSSEEPMAEFVKRC